MKELTLRQFKIIDACLQFEDDKADEGGFWFTGDEVRELQGNLSDLIRDGERWALK